MSRRKDANKKLVKNYLLSYYGNYCMLCGNHFKRDELTLHHIIEWQYCHQTTIENGSIVCKHCHFNVINKTKYNSKEYNQLMAKIILRKKKRAS